MQGVPLYEREMCVHAFRLPPRRWFESFSIMYWLQKGNNYKLYFVNLKEKTLPVLQSQPLDFYHITETESETSGLQTYFKFFPNLNFECFFRAIF